MAVDRILSVSFEISTVDRDRAEYQRIHSSLNDAIQEGLAPGDWWAENTSYYVVRTAESPSGFLSRVWNAARMRGSRDRILVLDSDGRAGAAYGDFTDATVFALLPYVKRLNARR